MSWFLLLGPKPTWKGKGLLQFMVQSPLLRELRGGTQGTNLEAGTEANTIKNTAQWLVTHFLLIQPRTTCQECQCPQGAGPSHISQENNPLTGLQTKLMEAIPQIMTLTYVNVTQKVSNQLQRVDLAHSFRIYSLHLVGEVWKLRQLHSECKSM